MIKLGLLELQLKMRTTTLVLLLVVLVAVALAVPRQRGSGRWKNKKIAKMHEDRKLDWNDVKKHRGRKFSERIRGRMRDLSKKTPRGWRRRGHPKYVATTTTTTTTRASIVGPPVVHRRVDLRLMTRDEWKQYTDAFNSLAQVFPDPENPVSLLDIFTGYHRKSESPPAHYGPGFIPWHATYMQSLVNAMFDKFPNVTIPIWDSRPDSEIPSHCDSCIFTEDLLGNNQGTVSIGAFKNKKVYPEDCQTAPAPLLTRECLAEQGLLYNYEEFNEVITTKTRLEDFVQPYTEVFEENHGGLHDAIGGHIGVLTCAPNDPTFYMLHGFVHAMFDLTMDRVYATANEQAAQSYPTRSDIPSDQLGTSLTLPFDMPLAQALKESLERDMQYTLVPDTCSTDADCNHTGSDFNAYWCKSSSSRCASKIRIGGVCQDSTGQFPDKACFRESFCAEEPICSTGKCQCTKADGTKVTEPPTV